MIKIEVLKTGKQIDKVIIKGHAMYDDYGKDIVCAAVSSIVTTTVNAVLRINEKALKYDYKQDTLDIDINVHDSIIDSLIENMLDLLTQLQKQYNENIKINI